eukprot:3350260-Rhodomonas_salina.1
MSAVVAMCGTAVDANGAAMRHGVAAMLVHAVGMVVHKCHDASVNGIYGGGTDMRCAGLHDDGQHARRSLHHSPRAPIQKGRLA